MGHLRLLQLDLLDVAAVVAPSSLILQVLGHLIQKSLRIVLKVQPTVVEVPLGVPDFQELVSNLFPGTQR